MTTKGKTILVASLCCFLVTAFVVIVWQWSRDDIKQENTKHFQDIAEEVGLTFKHQYIPAEQGETYKVNLYDHGCGLAVADFNGDGYDDIYFVNQLGENHLYQNKGDGTFEDVTQKAGIALGDRICTAATFADYDNDGHQDLFITSTRGGNILFHNEGNGTFKDVTKEANLSHFGHCQSAFFFDYDNDGKLDLLLLQTGSWTHAPVNDQYRYYPGKVDLMDIAASPKEYNILYHNNGDGTFTDVTEQSGLKGQGWAADAAIFDYNNDGKIDVLITSMFGRSQLYRNNGNGAFTDVTLDVLGRTPAGGMGAKAFDFDNDGNLDLYIVDMHSDMWINPNDDPKRFPEGKKYKYMFVPPFRETPKYLEYEKKITSLIGLKYQEVVFGNTFHRNLGNGKFEETSDRAGLETIWPWGIATGDFDNDGYEDVFIPSGMGYPYKFFPNRLLMNKGNRPFQERSADEGLEQPRGGIYLEETIGGKQMARSSRAAAVADFDGDGRLDIVVNNFNDRPYYYRNQSPQKAFVAFRLQGTRSNRDAIGAVVRLYVGGQIMTRQVHSAGGYLTQSSRTLHFGLGERTAIDKIEITWPSGIIQHLNPVSLNARHDIVEPTK